MIAEKVVLITGGTGALGKTVSRTFLEAGYRVMVTYRSEAELADLEQLTADHQDHFEAIKADVTNSAELKQVATQIETHHGGLSALLCLVGGYSAGTLTEDVAADFDKMITLNTKSFLLTINEMAPLLKMTASQLGQASHVIGVAARPALVPTKNLGLYAASKAALASLVQTLALELREESVSVNAVAPSTIDTPANRQAMTKVDPEKWVKPQELADLMLFLTSQERVVTSGAIIPVYGKA